MVSIVKADREAIDFCRRLSTVIPGNVMNFSQVREAKIISACMRRVVTESLSDGSLRIT